MEPTCAPAQETVTVRPSGQATSPSIRSPAMSRVVTDGRYGNEWVTVHRSDGMVTGITWGIASPKSAAVSATVPVSPFTEVTPPAGPGGPAGPAGPCAPASPETLITASGPAVAISVPGAAVTLTVAGAAGVATLTVAGGWAASTWTVAGGAAVISTVPA